jgi:DNA-binding beta-propeller fold protein YncE
MRAGTVRRSRKRLVASAIGIGALTASVVAATSPANAAVTSRAASGFTAPNFVRTIGKAGDAYVYPWGMATETFGPYAGDIVVGDYNNYVIKIFSPTGTLVDTLNTRGKALSSSVGPMGQPYGIAVDPNDGSIYVADLNKKRIDKFNDAGVFQYVITPPRGYYAPYVAVNAAGDLFIAESTITDVTGTNEIFEYSNTGTPITTYVGTDGTDCALGQFGNIRGIDVDASGLLYVTDTTNHCIQVFNTENGAAASAWVFEGSFGSSAQFSGDTRNLTIDRADNMVYVADAGNDVVDVFSTWNGGKGGVFKGTIGTPGLDPGQLGGARGVAIGLAGTKAQGTVWVSDYTYWRINSYAPLYKSSLGSPGEWLTQIPATPMPPPPGGFDSPTGVSVSTYPGTAGDIYVGDTFNQRIQEFSKKGVLLNYWGTRLDQLNAPYALDYPRGVAVDPATGNVWVNDTRSGYVKEYTSNGTYIAEYGGPKDFNYAVGIFVANGEVYAPDSNNDRLQVLSTKTGDEVAGFPVPCGTGIGYGDDGGCTGVTVDSAGNIYAAAQEENLVEVYNAAGKLLSTIGPANLNGPYDVAVSGTTLFVTDLNSSQVSEFDIANPVNAQFLGSWSGTGSGKFSSPRGISIDAAGNIYVVDYGGSRVVEFKP